MKKSLSLVLLLLLFTQKVISQTRFEGEIKAYERADESLMPASNANLFFGASSIRLWKTMAKDFAGYQVINRGFGGATLAEVNYYFDRMVPKYKPAKLFIYAGENDIAAGSSPEQVFEELKILVEKIKNYDSNLPWVYISMKPSVLREEQYEKQKIGNKLIADYLKNVENARFVNIVKPMRKNGKARADLFIGDKLHMNEKGYAIWVKKLKKHVVHTPLP